jgi:hypothetical protein
MNEVEIIRLNIERYQRLLQSELDETARRTIQRMLDEFEAKLSLVSPTQPSKNILIHNKAGETHVANINAPGGD